MVRTREGERLGRRACRILLWEEVVLRRVGRRNQKSSEKRTIRASCIQVGLPRKRQRKAREALRFRDPRLSLTRSFYNDFESTLNDTHHLCFSIIFSLRHAQEDRFPSAESGYFC